LAAAVLSAIAPMVCATVLTFDDLSGTHFFVSSYKLYSGSPLVYTSAVVTPQP
jgi:hypothetical protein